jgi:hypothetical protein
VQVAAGSTGQTLVDARPTPPTPEGIERLKARAGTAYAQLLQQGETFGRELRAELNQLAGGTAPASVQAMADLCVSSLMLHRAAALLAYGHLAKITEAEVDADVQQYDERFQKGARTAAGLAVQAKDQLVTTRQMAVDSQQLVPAQGSSGPPNGSASALTSLGIVASPIEGDDA